MRKAIKLSSQFVQMIQLPVFTSRISKLMAQQWHVLEI